MIKALARNWKAVLAFLLAVAAVLVYTQVYTPKKEAFIAERDQLKADLAAAQEAAAAPAAVEEVPAEVPAEEPAVEPAPAA